MNRCAFLLSFGQGPFFAILPRRFRISHIKARNTRLSAPANQGFVVSIPAISSLFYPPCRVRGFHRYIPEKAVSCALPVPVPAHFPAMGTPCRVFSQWIPVPVQQVPVIPRPVNLVIILLSISFNSPGFC